VNQRIADIARGSKVVATAAVTWLTVAAVVVQSIVAEFGGDWPWIADYGSRAVIVIGAAIVIIRRVEPVPKDRRRVLP